MLHRQQIQTANFNNHTDRNMDMTIKEITTGAVRLGSTFYDTAFDVKVTIRALDKNTPTYDHSDVDGQRIRISFTGSEYDKSKEYGTEWSAGQNYERMDNLAKLSTGWSVGRINALTRLWVTMHLNDAKAGCKCNMDRAAQLGLAHSRQNYKEFRDAVGQCPVTGGMYGDTWFYRHPTQDELGRLFALFPSLEDAYNKEFLMDRALS